MNVDFHRAFAGKSVFITGHTGFKGSWLCMWLAKLQAEVTGYALAPPTAVNNFEVCQLPDLLRQSHLADVRDAETLESAIAAAQPEIIFHLAAQSVVRQGYKSPRETFETNMMGTVNVLEAVRRLDRPCTVVCVTSDKCYENREQVWGYREDDPMGEHDPYGSSKGAAELAIRSYRHAYFAGGNAHRKIKLASGRAGNVLGGGDFTPDALLVDMVHSLARNLSIPIRSPYALRPWQHVLQALSGYLTLAARLVESDAEELQSGFNFGPLPGNELPVKEVADLFLRYWGSGDWEDVSDPTQPHEATILRLAIDKALWQLRWRPAWDIRKTLEMTAQWYQEYFRGDADMRQLSFDQIDHYTADMLHAPEPHPENGAAPAKIAPLAIARQAM